MVAAGVHVGAADARARSPSSRARAGHCSERGPHGFRCDWGRVVTCEPPGKIAFTWQISPQRVPQPDPAQASLVEVRFDADGDGDAA